jgi:hypothetical protein
MAAAIWYALDAENRAMALSLTREMFSENAHLAYNFVSGEKKGSPLEILNQIWHQFVHGALFTFSDEDELEEKLLQAADDIKALNCWKIGELLAIRGKVDEGYKISVSNVELENVPELKLDVAWALETMCINEGVPAKYIASVAVEAGIDGYSEDEIKTERAFNILGDN